MTNFLTFFSLHGLLFFDQKRSSFIYIVLEIDYYVQTLYLLLMKSTPVKCSKMDLSSARSLAVLCLIYPPNLRRRIRWRLKLQSYSEELGMPSPMADGLVNFQR
jgi:hypothetical protein